MKSLALSSLVLAITAACADDDGGPLVVESDASPLCGPAARMVHNVCTEIGPDDGCVAHDDVCVPLCDGVQACSVVEPDLRVLSGWPTAPEGYCVVCAQP